MEPLRSGDKWEERLAEEVVNKIPVISRVRVAAMMSTRAMYPGTVKRTPCPIVVIADDCLVRPFHRRCDGMWQARDFLRLLPLPGGAVRFELLADPRLPGCNQRTTGRFDARP